MQQPLIIIAGNNNTTTTIILASYTWVDDGGNRKMPETRYVLIHVLVQLRIRASILYSRSRSENRVPGIFQSVRKMTVTIIIKKKKKSASWEPLR